jgi:hypothetical protein
MNNQFTILWQNNTITVNRMAGNKYYSLTFPNAEIKLLENNSHGWRYIDPTVKDQDAVESELLDEESSLELGLEVEAEEIGQLILEKEGGNFFQTINRQQ